MEPTPDYWAAISQIALILGAALLIQARIILRSWIRVPPLRFLASIVGIINLVIMLVFAQVVTGSIRALRGEEVSEWLVPAGETAAAVAVVMVLVTPASDLTLKSFPQPFAALMTIHPRLRLRATSLRLRLFFASQEHRLTRWWLIRKLPGIEARIKHRVQEIDRQRTLRARAVDLSPSETRDNYLRDLDAWLEQESSYEQDARRMLAQIYRVDEESTRNFLRGHKGLQAEMVETRAEIARIAKAERAAFVGWAHAQLLIEDSETPVFGAGQRSNSVGASRSTVRSPSRPTRPRGGRGLVKRRGRGADQD